jgi:hypothetical protein
MFHHGLGLDASEQQLSSGFWTVDASGRRYNREVVLDVLRERFADPHDDPWARSKVRMPGGQPRHLLIDLHAY